MNNEFFNFILVLLVIVAAVLLVAMYGPVAGFISAIFIAGIIGLFLKVFKKFR